MKVNKHGAIQDGGAIQTAMEVYEINANHFHFYRIPKDLNAPTGMSFSVTITLSAS